MKLRQFLGAPPTCNVTTGQIEPWSVMLLALAAEMPDLDLTQEQLDLLNGHMLPIGPALVHLVARALSEQGALFPDVPFSAGDLTDPQARADAWRTLRDAAQFIVDHADLACRLEQALAVFRAMLAVRQVRADQQRPFPGPEERARQQALEPAELLLAGHQAVLKHR